MKSGSDRNIIYKMPDWLYMSNLSSLMLDTNQALKCECQGEFYPQI